MFSSVGPKTPQLTPAIQVERSRHSLEAGQLPSGLCPVGLADRRPSPKRLGSVGPTSPQLGFVDKGPSSTMSSSWLSNPMLLFPQRHSVPSVGAPRALSTSFAHSRASSLDMAESMRARIRCAPEPEQIFVSTEVVTELIWHQKPPCIRCSNIPTERLFMAKECLVVCRRETESFKCQELTLSSVSEPSGLTEYSPKVLKYTELRYLGEPLSTYRYKITNHTDAIEQVYLTLSMERREQNTERLSNKTLIIKGRFPEVYGSQWDTYNVGLYHDPLIEQTCVCTLHRCSNNRDYWLGIWNISQVFAERVEPAAISPTASDSCALDTQPQQSSIKRKDRCCIVA